MSKASAKLETSEPVVVELPMASGATGFVGPLASIASAEQAQPDSVRKQALADVTTAEAEVQSSEAASGPRYAKVIRAVIHCLAIQLTRKEIAGAVEAASHPSECPVMVRKFTGGQTETTVGKPGRVARYVKLAQWEQGEYGDAEVRPEKVVIMGEPYTSPLVALDSAKHNFTAVYQAWRNATAQPLDFSDFRSQIEGAAEASIWDSQKKNGLRARIRTKTEDGSEEIKGIIVVDDAKATFGALRGLLKYGKASERLAFAKRKVLGEMLGLVVEDDAVTEPEAAS